MPSLSQAIISNVGTEYIETYFREHKLSRREDQSGMALKYWAELGLTASSFKKLNVQVENSKSLEDFLNDIANG